jgi:hypothetical protein
MPENTQAQGSELSDGLGGVLAYCTKGRTRGVGGQTVGANGEGQYAVLIKGTPEEAENYARKRIKEMEAAGYEFNYIVFAANGEDWGNFGNPVSTVQAT